MQISIFAGSETDTGPQTITLESFSDVAVATIDSAWSPFLFKEKRVLADFISTDLLVFDIDEGMTLALAEKVLAPYQYILVTTRNHQQSKHDKPPCDRFRIILKLSSTITSHDVYKATREHFGQYLCPSYDRASTDCFFYKSRDIVAVNAEGLEIHPQQPRQLIQLTQSSPVSLPAGVRGDLSRRTLKFMVNGAPPGQWNIELFRAAKDFFEQGYSEEEFVDRANKIQNPLDATDLQTVHSAYSRAPRYEPRLLERADQDPDDEKKSIVDLADSFLLIHGYTGKFKYWQGDFYFWVGTKYVRRSVESVMLEILKWLQDGELRKKAGQRLANEIVANVKALTSLPDETQPPIFIIGENRTKNIIPLQNGLLNVETQVLEPHTPDFFSLVCLPYCYDEAAVSPTWQRFLEHCQPDVEVRNLLQEWFGYNLVYETGFHQWALLEGQGANGKSVVCTVLREMLGPDNTSAVSLEGFNPNRTFSLALTAGKLANIVEEMNEIDKTSEGMLKDYTGGGVISVERKHRDAFNLQPTARLTFATNVLPRFTDRSDGLWRRLLHIPFKTQILDKTKQDRNLVSAEWWRKSGELPGVLNWALEGLRRLRSNGYFTEPAVSVAAKAAYRSDLNPAANFLIDHYELDPTGQEKLFKTDIYKAYVTYARELGFFPLSEVQFAKEVVRAFPKAHASPNPIWMNGRKGRIWVGIKSSDKTEVQSVGTLLQLKSYKPDSNS